MNKTYEDMDAVIKELTNGNYLLYRDSDSECWNIGSLTWKSYTEYYGQFSQSIIFNLDTMHLVGTTLDPSYRSMVFREGDAVLCRDKKTEAWQSRVFSHMEPDRIFSFIVHEGDGLEGYRFCIPFDADKVGTI